MSEASTNSNGRQSQTVDRTEASTPLEIPARSHDPLPCPFCGSDEVSVENGIDSGYRVWFVLCENCHAAGPLVIAGKGPDAMKWWNRRAGQVADEPSATGDGE